MFREVHCVRSTKFVDLVSVLPPIEIILFPLRHGAAYVIGSFHDVPTIKDSRLAPTVPLIPFVRQNVTHRNRVSDILHPAQKQMTMRPIANLAAFPPHHVDQIPLSGVASMRDPAQPIMEPLDTPRSAADP
jgi:hypothetical protein